MRQRDKSNLPLPFLSYKYFLLQYSFSILSFYSLNPTFLAAALPKNFKNFGKDLLQQSSESSILPSPREEMAINFVVPEVNSSFPFSFIPLSYSCSFANLFTEYPFFSFSLLLFLFLQSSNPLGLGR